MNTTTLAIIILIAMNSISYWWGVRVGKIRSKVKCSICEDIIKEVIE